MSEPTYAQTVTRLAREWRSCRPVGKPVPASDCTRIVSQLHAAADVIGISHSDAARDLFDEIHAEPVA